jgi:Flp pilus assembly protein protease CpaA
MAMASSTYDSPVTVAAFLAHSLPLVLIAAVSPVLFLNASRVVEAAGISAGFSFACGAVLCLVALGIPTMGLMGAATSRLVAVGLASRGVDLALALVLITYGAGKSPGATEIGLLRVHRVGTKMRRCPRAAVLCSPPGCSACSPTSQVCRSI